MVCESGEKMGEVPSSVVCEGEERALPTSSSLGNETCKGGGIPFSMVGEGKEDGGEVSSSSVALTVRTADSMFHWRVQIPTPQVLITTDPGQSTFTTNLVEGKITVGGVLACKRTARSLTSGLYDVFIW